MSESYLEKENARMELEHALRQYKEAAEKHGMSPEDMANEIDDCIADLSFDGLRVVTGGE